jgi:hypothetical protein
MKTRFFSATPAVLIGLVLCSQSAMAQTTSVQIFGAVNVRSSESSATHATPDIFSSTTQNLTCGASPSAILSGPLMNGGGTAPALTEGGALQGGGSLLVDNNILVTVTAGETVNAANVCTGGTSDGNFPDGTFGNLGPNCFTSGYQGIAGSLIGDDPDTAEVPANTGPTIDYLGGVAQIDISSLLVPGAQQSVNIGLADYGGELVSSTIFLTTNCTVGGVTGPATVSGNPISGTNDQGTTQTFNFNTLTGQQVGFVYDVTNANTQGTLNQNQDGSIPQTSDMPVDPSTFQPSYVAGTSFATSNCLVHTGELLADGTTQACKLYTLTCVNPLNSNEAGANCPVSAVNNEVIQDVFDGPQFNLQDIFTPFGTFHEGIGLLMASEPWPMTSGAPSPQPGPCTFDPSSGLGSVPCPQNLLISFSGPGGFGGKGLTTNPNSTFISIYGVPEDLTSVSVTGELPDHWVNTSTPKVKFVSQAPNLSTAALVQNGRGMKPLPGAKNYIPAPIASITYGISPANSVPLPINEPIAGDTTLESSADCAAAPFTAKKEPNFAPPVQTLPTLEDGQYLLHYYAEDCAGTQELEFTKAPVTESWSTNFYTVPINVDTTPPAINNLSLSPAGPSFEMNSKVYATFNCTDAATGAGVVQCGANTYAPESTYATGTLTVKLSTVPAGSKTFTVYAVDGAGNVTSTSIHYTVTK